MNIHTLSYPNNMNVLTWEKPYFRKIKDEITGTFLESNAGNFFSAQTLTYWKLPWYPLALIITCSPTMYIATYGCLAVTIWRIFIHSGIFSLWSTIFFFRWETLTQAEGGGKLMVAASKAAQILAQMIGKLQKYGRRNTGCSPSFGPGQVGEKKGSFCTVCCVFWYRREWAVAGDKNMFCKATLRIY